MTLNPDWLTQGVILDPDKVNRSALAVGKSVKVPHAKQIEIDKDESRFIIARAGRRFGKTTVAAKKLIRTALKQPGSLGWWVSNEWKNAQRGYLEVLSQIPPGLLTKKPPVPSSKTLVLNLVGGSRIEFYTGSNPDAMAGAGVDYVVVDEAALIPHGERVWQQIIFPTLLTTEGKAFIISTPRGRDWFWRLWMMGHKGAKDHSSYHFTSYDTPYASEDGLAQMKAGMTEMFFRQEMLAEFVANAASIFSLHHPMAVQDELVEPSGDVAVGIDLGKKEDSTVITAARFSDRRPCYYQKISSTRWVDQKTIILDAIAEIQEHYAVDSVFVGVDSSGVGDPMLESLEEEGIDVEGVVFSNQWKEAAVRALAADLEQGHAAIYADMREEFESYEYTMTDAGRYKFEAATGHDDDVSAKLIEHWILTRGGAGEARLVEGGRPADTGEVVHHGVDSPQDIMARPSAWNRVY